MCFQLVRRIPVNFPGTDCNAAQSQNVSAKAKATRSSESSKIINLQSVGLMMCLQTLHVGHLSWVTQQCSGQSDFFPSLAASDVFSCLQETNSFPSWKTIHTYMHIERDSKTARERQCDSPFIHSFIHHLSQFIPCWMRKSEHTSFSQWRWPIAEMRPAHRNNLLARQKLLTRRSDRY